MAARPDLPDRDLFASLAPPPAWIETREGVPYFFEGRRAWTPVGQNDAISWPEFDGLFRRRDLPGVEAHLWRLRKSGVTCLRLMLEYAQTDHRYLERPVGCFPPDMVRLWDDLFALCERVGIRILLTPFDTFFTWRRWGRHPYNAKNGGPCSSRRRLLTCASTRTAIKNRLEFATRRWGGSGALFAWDLWNEADPAHGGGDPACVARFIDDVGPWLRDLETRLHGRAHPQTVSVFGPVLEKHPELADPIFRHPALDFATIHLYEKSTIDNPRDTVAPALAAGRLMRAAVGHAGAGRPVLDSEHGPIASYRDPRRPLCEAFDDEYFRYIQWAHLASGGAGGGMRWPYRRPHVLTHGMRAAQSALAKFLPLIDWTSFGRFNLGAQVQSSDPRIAVFACGDPDQAVLWLLRTDAARRRKPMRADLPPVRTRIAVPGLNPGRFAATVFDTRTGQALAIQALGESEPLNVDVETDLAIALVRQRGA